MLVPPEKRDALRTTWVKAGTVTANTLEYKCINLFEGGDYVFRVFAENRVGPSLKAAELDKPVRAKMPFGKYAALMGQYRASNGLMLPASDQYWPGTGPYRHLCRRRSKSGECHYGPVPGQ